MREVLPILPAKSIVSRPLDETRKAVGLKNRQPASGSRSAPPKTVSGAPIMLDVLIVIDR
jgi:hypothetical protein